MTIDTTLPVARAHMGELRRDTELDPRRLRDGARDLAIAGGAPDLVVLLDAVAHVLERADVRLAEVDIARAMDQLRALATSNVHVALALALDESPQRTDAQLVEKARTAHQTARDALRAR